MLLLGAVVLVDLVMSVVVFPSSRFLVSGGWGWGRGGSACCFVFSFRWMVLGEGGRPVVFNNLLQGMQRLA